ncbi:flavocytochrome c [Treponema sp. OMZ 840]|uniref:flavocytochrome c n=1 Tax=Treponema sp. OMZ 840 TaxID=244313 RepID=UPI003D8DCCA0
MKNGLKIMSVLLLTAFAGCSGTSSKYDVIVVGAGGAGFSAAISAKEHGAKVIMFEKMAFVGGNSVRSKGGMNAADTVPQKNANISDNVESFIADTMKGGKNKNNPDLVRFLAENSAATVDWLSEMGADLSEVARGAAQSAPRMHRPKGGKNVGGMLIATLSERAKKDNIKIELNTEVVEIIMKNGAAVGVKTLSADGKKADYFAKSVIIATGGFGANEAMYTKYRKDLAGFITTNHKGATGDGIIMAEKVGAALVDMDQIQTNPTVEQTTAEVISESVRGLGAVFVNQNGVRFTNEMLARDVLSAKILEQPGKAAYLIFADEIRANMAALDKTIEKGIVAKGDTAEALASQINVDAKTFAASLQKWNAGAKNAKDSEFGRTAGFKFLLDKGPFYAIKVGPGVHHTMGGIKINTDTQVIDTAGNVIKGLYAAGEVTGGVHGANRLGGNAVTDITVFGRQAGLKAAEYAQKK